MKMGRLEKRFINATDHSRRVADLAERRLGLVPLSAAKQYLDVGCGNRAATRHVAGAFDLDATGIDVDADQIRLDNGRKPRPGPLPGWECDTLAVR